MIKSIESRPYERNAIARRARIARETCYDVRPSRPEAHMDRSHPEGLIGIALAAALAWQASGSPAHSETTEEFYKSHPLSIVIGFPPASAYDLYGRAVGRHIGKHIPGNPAVLPLNQAGARRLEGANFLYSIAPRDGSTIGILSRSAPLDPL